MKKKKCKIVAIGWLRQGDDEVRRIILADNYDKIVISVNENIPNMGYSIKKLRKLLKKWR